MRGEWGPGPPGETKRPFGLWSCASPSTHSSSSPQGGTDAHTTSTYTRATRRHPLSHRSDPWSHPFLSTHTPIVLHTQVTRLACIPDTYLCDPIYTSLNYRLQSITHTHTHTHTCAQGLQPVTHDSSTNIPHAHSARTAWAQTCRGVASSEFPHGIPNRLHTRRAKGGERETTGKAGRSRRVGAGVHKQENLPMRSWLTPTRRSPNSPARILTVYTEALTGSVRCTIHTVS